MDPKVVLVTTWVLAGLVVAAYIWFVVWRFRVEKRKKEAQGVTDAAMSDAIAKTAAAASAAPVPSPAAMPTPASPTPASPTPVVEPIPPMPEATVASCLSGISLPHDLVPLTTMLARPAIGDRVAFWTDRAPAEIVGPAFSAELERLGYTVQPLDERTLSAQRDGARLLVMIHADGASAVIGDQLAFSTVPEHSVVIETWLPA
jgi:hypothetical protein